MRRMWLFALLSAFWSPVSAQQVSSSAGENHQKPNVEPVVFGEYLELRSDLTKALLPANPAAADVEDLALRRRSRPFEHRTVLVWRVRHGEWNGQDLAGLTIVAIVESQGTINTKVEGDYRTLLLVDADADKKQKEALVTLVREAAPRFARRVKTMRTVKMLFTQEKEDLLLQVGKELSLRVQPHEHDGELCESVCGKDPQPQKALSRYVESHRAKALRDLYSGRDLNVRWSAADSGRTLAGRFGL